MPSKKFALITSSTDSTYIIAYIMVSFIFGHVSINIKSIIAAIILFGIIFLGLHLIKSSIPMTKSAKRRIEEKKEKEKRIKAGKKGARKRKLKKVSK